MTAVLFVAVVWLAASAGVVVFMMGATRKPTPVSPFVEVVAEAERITYEAAR